MKELVKSVLNKKMRLFLRRVYYYGVRYRCPICGSNVRAMFDAGLPLAVLHEVDIVGGERLQHDVCPVCFAHSRTRLLWEYFHRELRFEEWSMRPKILHVAPEYGLARYLSSVTEYIGGDIDPAPFEGYGAVAYCDITKISFPNDTFDLIICSHVLEHVPRDDVAIMELYRVLRPGGAAILQVPIGMALDETIEDRFLKDPRERERRFGQYDHVRIYGRDYPQRLAAGGFVVEVFDPGARWGADVVTGARLNPRERIFVGRKGTTTNAVKTTALAANTPVKLQGLLTPETLSL